LQDKIIFYIKNLIYAEVFVLNSLILVFILDHTSAQRIKNPTNI